MKIGIISDTHDNIPVCKKLIRHFLEEKIEVLIHCGDIISPFMKRVFIPLYDHGIKMYGVMGNNDGEKAGLMKILGTIMELTPDFYELEFASKQFLVVHHLPENLIQSIAESQKFDYILKGHLHEKRNEKIGKTRVINPGEACGYLTGIASIVILDTDKDSVRFFDLPVEV
jgi:putative phosphoesterase